TCLSRQSQGSLKKSMGLRRVALRLGYSPEIAQHCCGWTTQSQGAIQQILRFRELAPLGRQKPKVAQNHGLALLVAQLAAYGKRLLISRLCLLGSTPCVGEATQIAEALGLGQSVAEFPTEGESPRIGLPRGFEISQMLGKHAEIVLRLRLARSVYCPTGCLA